MTQENPTQEAQAQEEGKKRERIMSFHVTEDGNIRVEFATEGVEPVDVAVAALPGNILSQAANEGLISRLRRFGEAGENAAEKRVGILEGLSKLLAGEWFMPRGRPAGEGTFTLLERAAHEYKLAKAAALGQEYTGSLADTAKELEPIIAEHDAVSESIKGKDRKEIDAALAGTKLGKLKSTTLFAAAWAKVKAADAAEKAAKAAEKAAKESQEEKKEEVSADF